MTLITRKDLNRPTTYITGYEDGKQDQRLADLKEFLEWLDDILIGFEPDELPVIIQMQQKRIGRLIKEMEK